MLAVSMVMSRLNEMQKNIDSSKDLLKNITPDNLAKINENLDQIGEAKDFAKSSLKNVKSMAKTMEALKPNEKEQAQSKQSQQQQEQRR
jgi:hypothetical protein